MGIFNEDELAADAVKAPPEEERQQDGQQPPVQDDRPRDEHGRFAPKQAEAGEEQQQPGKDPQERTVEHGALHSEREKRKHWEGEAKRAQEQLAAIAELRKKVQGGGEQQQQQPPPIGQQPQEETTEQLRARLARLEQAEQQRGQASDHARLDDMEHRNLAQALVSAEADFSARVPDYNDATVHLATSRARELQLYGMDPVSIQQTLAEEALEITRTAIGLGKSPAELAYEIAQMRGYQPKQGGQAKPNGSGGGNSAVDLIEAIRRGQESSKSLGSGGGSGGAGEVNAQALASMDEGEFARLYSTPEGKRLIDSLS